MAAPVNTVVPAVTGTIQVGETLTCSTGTWTGGVTGYTYQWQNAQTGEHAPIDIVGAVGNTYVIGAADCHHTLRCAVTATNNTGSTLAYSLPTTEVPDDYFIPEDGTGLATANSYTSVAAADMYHATRGNSAWGLLEHGLKKAALIRATDYMEARWATRYRGEEQFPDTPQALSFPRFYIGWDSEVPTGIQRACAEYALRSSTAALAPDSTYDATGLALSTTRTKVGPIETEKRYLATNVSGGAFRAYPLADTMVKPFLTGGGLVR